MADSVRQAYLQHAAADQETLSSKSPSQWTGKGVFAGDQEYFAEAFKSLRQRYLQTNHPYQHQRNYLRYPLFMMNNSLKEFKAKLLKHNNYLWYFPVSNKQELVKSLPTDKLVKIIDHAKRVKWQIQLGKLTCNMLLLTKKL